MDRFKVGDKVYSKEGNTGKELGTVIELGEKTVKIRIFKDYTSHDFLPQELLTKEDHMELSRQVYTQTPQSDPNRWRIG